MAKLQIGMQGATTDLESLTRLLWLANYLSIPGEAEVISNVQYIGISVSETQVDWDAVERSALDGAMHS